jgi:hypothetical protein
MRCPSIHGLPSSGGQSCAAPCPRVKLAASRCHEGTMLDRLSRIARISAYLSIPSMNLLCMRNRWVVRILVLKHPATPVCYFSASLPLSRPPNKPLPQYYVRDRQSQTSFRSSIPSKRCLCVVWKALNGKETSSCHLYPYPRSH